MKRVVVLLVLLGMVGGVRLQARDTASAAVPHEAGSTFVLSTLQGIGDASSATGNVTSDGLVGTRLRITVQLHNMPAPQTLGGTGYVVWLVASLASPALRAGILYYHADGTADGTWTTKYHDFTGIAVTAEQNVYTATPQNPTVVAGDVAAAQLQAAEATTTGQLVVQQQPQAAASYSTQTSDSSFIAAQGTVTLPRKTRSLVIYNRAVSRRSIILIMPLSNPYGTLWISARGAGRFTISASGALPAPVTVQYAVVNG